MNGKYIQDMKDLQQLYSVGEVYWAEPASYISDNFVITSDLER